MEETNKPRLNVLIKAPIIIIAIVVLILDYKQLVDYYTTVGNNGGISEYFKIAFSTSILRSSLLLIIPFSGVFINNKIGWLLICSFYYFWLLFFIYFSISTELERDGTIVFVAGVIIISIFLLLLMNSYENSKLVYGIKRSDLLKTNIAAFIIAIIEILLIVLLNFTKA
ncbi:hypothetical protein [Olleya sp. 1-3]|uniref:hypothetical protein n=1 Tax=Olleya sp. 1-3 TaxID=2058323 RepID=UPI000C327EA4|nr:hypothetical protein [Olleya sp. 1-3]PKG52284.1 hypothetical protein CXF54_04240 [Olleya sp. 1-3]